MNIWYVVADMDDGHASTRFFKDYDAYNEYYNYAYDGGFALTDGAFDVDGEIYGIYFFTMKMVLELMAEEER